MHHAIGGLAIIALIAFAFGERTARVVVGVGLLTGLAAFMYVAVLIVTGAI